MNRTKAQATMVSRRQFLHGAAAIAGTALVAACVPPTAAPSGAPQSSAPVISDKPLAGTTINVLAPRITFTDATQSQLAKLEEATGITAKFDVFAEKEAQQKIAVELAAGSNAYDVVWTGGNGVPQKASAGWLEPLDPFVEREDPDVLRLDDFLPPLLNSGRWDGKLYALPVFLGTQLFYYRKDIVDTPPDDFDSLMAAAQEYHNNPLAAFAIRGARGADSALWPFPIFMLGFGGSWFKDYPADMHPTYDSPEAIRAAEYWVELLSNYGMPNVASAHFDEVLIAVSEGQAAMAIEGAPLAARLFDPEQSKVHDKLGMTLVPSGPAGRFPPFSPHHWGMPASAPNKDAAWEFIKWALSEETQLQGALSTNHIAVSRASVWENPEFRQKYNYGGGETFVELFFQSAMQASELYRPPIPEWPQLGDRLSVALNEALTGQKSAEQAMLDAQEDLYQLFKDAGYYDS
ncbi:MAG: extracellular solute-binding protein [Caldilineaceae bacterium]|nr:extracellular solute-binding protein [Caldilineaceae bacterium]